MDTTQEFQQVLNKKERGVPATYRDVAVAIANHEQTLLQYLADNDFQQVYSLLHKSDAPMSIGRQGVKFIPDKKRVEAELSLLLGKKEEGIINDILENFRINMTANNYTSNNNLIQAMKDIDLVRLCPGDPGTGHATSSGYCISARVQL